MNTLKNLGIIFLGNLLAGLAYVSGVSFYYAIDGGYDALSLIGFLFFFSRTLAFTRQYRDFSVPFCILGCEKY
jgi:hypothetical protein